MSSIIVPESDSSSGLLKFAFPSPKARTVTSRFGMRMHPTKNVMSMHNGIDLADSGCENTSVVSVANGIIVDVGYDTSRGKNVKIKHTIDGKLYITNYYHLNRIDVNENETVTRGQQIGLIGKTGQGTGAHLHFEVRPNGGNAVDPYPYIF